MRAFSRGGAVGCDGNCRSHYDDSLSVGYTLGTYQNITVHILDES